MRYAHNGSFADVAITDSEIRFRVVKNEPPEAGDVGLGPYKGGVLSVGLYEMTCGGRYLSLGPACFA